jgi:D-threo-aldose 1-dehydrogenase
VRTIVLGETGVVTSALGFGCASLFREPSRRRRRLLLDAAYDAGIRHFDVAPMYGLGRVEPEVGRFLRGREDAVVATKFGISPAALGRALAPVQAQLQRLRGRSRGADPRAGAAGRLLYRSGPLDAATARAGLERSLRLLGRDHVDLFLVHEPPADGRVPDEVWEALDAARDAGLVRAFGAAGVHAAACAAAPVVQTRWSRVDRATAGDGRPTIRYGVLAGSLPALRDRLAGELDAAALAALLLQDALAAQPDSPVLFSTTDPARVASAAAAADVDDPEGLARFRALAAAADRTHT